MGNWKLVKQEVINGYPSYLIEGDNFDKLPITMQVWIAPHYGFTPVKYRQATHLKKGTSECIMSDVMLKQIDGIWVIVDVKAFIRNQVEPQGRWQSHHFHSMDYQVGVTFPEDYFKFKFEPGMKIVDNIAKVSYVVGDDGFPKNKISIPDLNARTCK